ncbi:hypothetical protein R1sor_013538 [Riccia sorocarpa]|uniref:Uncharacterized protein n=1 Tax=Riccia sorocarpa TaxID=122646 RepID=A0ABD3HD12_9MARC
MERKPLDRGTRREVQGRFFTFPLPKGEVTSCCNGHWLLGSLGAFNRTGDRNRTSKNHLDSGNFLEKPEHGTPAAVERFETRLLNILREVLLLSVQIEEADEGVWAVAFSCLLYFVCDRERIQRRLERSSGDKSGVRSELMGGIETTCDEYAIAKTPEAKRNLFAVLFDFVYLSWKRKLCEVTDSFRQARKYEQLQHRFVFRGIRRLCSCV